MPLGEFVVLATVADGLPAGRGRQKFFESRSLSTWLSSAWLATIRLSWRFSSSSARSRLASLTSMPPYLRFQLYSVSVAIPSCRQSSFVEAPAVCCLSAAMICSSVKRLLFIRLLLSFLRTRRTAIYSGTVLGEQVTKHARLDCLYGPRD